MEWQVFVLYPFRDPREIKKLLIGCVICIVPIINIIVVGYFMACLSNGIRGRLTLPDWNNWQDLARDSLFGLMILAVYLLIPLILVPFLMIIPLAGSLLLSMLMLLAGMLVPIAMGGYVMTCDIQYAFRLPDIIMQAVKIIEHYIPIYLAAAFIIAIGLAIILVIPYLSPVGAVIIFYTGIILFRSTGMLIRDSRYK